MRMYKVEVHPELGPCTCDYRVDRVRIFVSNDGKVVRPPMIG